MLYECTNFLVSKILLLCNFYTVLHVLPNLCADFWFYFWCYFFYYFLLPLFLLFFAATFFTFTFFHHFLLTLLQMILQLSWMFSSVLIGLLCCHFFVVVFWATTFPAIFFATFLLPLFLPLLCSPFLNLSTLDLFLPYGRPSLALHSHKI